ncbi:MAG: carbohydrate binding domain-containing protein, partial [Flammeovirgaceae bacterium]|nr:carbohydrate binding domain-containing protein [Flammeovirgaceae bacterium]
TTTIDVAGNATLKYAGLNYQGTDFAGNAQNVSAMNFLHLDYWTANSTALNVFIISPGPVEKAKALTVPTNGNWTSIDIPIADFSPVALINIIQFKFDGNGDIFLDNIYFYKSSGGGGGGGSNLAANGDFETGTDSGWVRFQNGGTSVLDNTTPNNGAGSWSGKLATGGPSNPAFKQERIGAGTVKAGDVVRIKFDHKGAVVQPGAVFNVLLFGEGASGASFTHVFNPAPTLGSGWTTFTGTFTIAGGTDVSQGISFLIEAVCGGDAGCSVSANIDNVSVVLNP